MDDAIGSLAGNVEERSFPRGDGAEEGSERDGERELEGVRKRVENEECETVGGFIEGEIECVLEGKQDVARRVICYGFVRVVIVQFNGIVCGLFGSVFMIMTVIYIMIMTMIYMVLMSIYVIPIVIVS